MMSGQGGNLPWETEDESLAILSQDLMEQVMSLSLCDENFTQAPDSDRLRSIPFDFDAFVPVIMRLLPLDSNLAAVHAKLSPRMDEQVLWRNFFWRVQYLRARIGMDGKEAKDGLGSEPQERIIMRFKGVVKQKPAAVASTEGEVEVVFGKTAEKTKDDVARDRKREQAALAAEVEAELLTGGDDGIEVDLDVDLDDLDMDMDALELDEEDLEHLSDLDESGLGVENSLLDAEIARELDEEFGGDDIEEEEGEEK